MSIPPLRERKEDIKEIARNFFERNGISYDEKVLEILTNYDFPGNVRELLKILNEVKQKKKRLVKVEDLKDILSNLKDCNELDELIIKIFTEELTWNEIKKLFLLRELSRERLKKMIKSILEGTSGRTYKEVADLLKTDYRKFMAFLHRHKII